MGWQGNICTHNKILDLTQSWRLETNETEEIAERCSVYKNAWGWLKFQVTITHRDKAETKYQWWENYKTNLFCWANNPEKKKKNIV